MGQCSRAADHSPRLDAQRPAGAVTSCSYHPYQAATVPTTPFSFSNTDLSHHGSLASLREKIQADNEVLGQDKEIKFNLMIAIQ